MSKDYTSVDIRNINLKGVELAREADKRCLKALGEVFIWSQDSIPHKLLITLDQFKEFARLRGDDEEKPNGKELFSTSNGYMFEIKVDK